MRTHFLLPFSLISSGLLLLVVPQSGAQAQTAPRAAAPAPGLFPDPEPVLVPKASLRGLLEALARGDGETVTPMTWQLLAAMYQARQLGTGPSEYLAAGYRAERLKGADAAAVQNCLLSAWGGAQMQTLFTPENLALMAQGTAPRGTRGRDQGKTVNLDLEKLPEVTLTTRAPSAAAPGARSLPAQSSAPLPEPVAARPAFVVKTLEVRLHDRVQLDDCGLRNMDFRVDSVDPHAAISFLFEDRTTHAFAQIDRSNLSNVWSRDRGFFDGVSRMTSFSPEPIPDTNKRGTKLLTLPFAAVYLDEDISVGVSFHIVVRVASEALMQEQLPLEKRKQFEIHSPAP